MAQITSERTSGEVFRNLSLDLERTTFPERIQCKDPESFRRNLYLFCRQFNDVFIHNNSYSHPHSSTDFVAALGSRIELKLTGEKGSFDAIKRFVSLHKGKWIFAAISYDLKNDTERVVSENPDPLEFPACHLFIPEIMISVNGSEIAIDVSPDFDAAQVYEQIMAIQRTDLSPAGFSELDFESRPDRKGYINIVTELLNEIKKGNIYEINFCREILKFNEIDPYLTALKLLDDSPAPFSVFYKTDGKYLICASPERFLLKSGDTLLSQPIKGTKGRTGEQLEDELAKQELLKSMKERAENAMIVDLVRNDLSRSAQVGSVEVIELFGIYTFPHVHQMISSIQSKLKTDVHFIDALRFCFPMGSMTGAPKLRALQLIEKHEMFKRSMFSGTAGIISPWGNFDFNVVIRAILYNSNNNAVSIRTGSAITSLCNAEEEWEECRLKANALINALCKPEK